MKHAEQRIDRRIARMYRDIDGYWIELVPGFRVAGDSHGIVEDTKVAALAKMADVVPCACADCRLAARRA